MLLSMQQPLHVPPEQEIHGRASMQGGHGQYAVPPQAVAAAQQQHQQRQPTWQEYNSVFTAAKAGMQNVDKEKVKKIVFEMSKDSAHFKNEQRKQAQTDAKIAQLKARAASLTQGELAALQKLCDARIVQLEATRDLSRTWLHVDMDAFYASVEELEQPELKAKPMAVGGMGMICTANYEARKYGVRSAMPGFIARKLCPALVFVKPDFAKYTAASAATRDVFRVYDPAFEAGSLDEAYLEVTDYCRQHGMSGEQVAAELRARVQSSTQLTCSVGVAPNNMLAKVASDLNKPNGQAVVGSSRDDVMAFIQDLPIRKIPGIGKVSEQTLNALGINTCSELLAQRALLAALFSPTSMSFFLGVGLGLGQTQHSHPSGSREASDPGRKGISCERTFGAMKENADMEAMADSLVQHLAADMASEGIEAKTLTLKLKTTAFAVRTRAATLPHHVSSAQQMLPVILRLLRAELPVEIRLMGVRGSNLRKVQKLEHMLGAEAKLNALQRMILLGRQQQQQGHHESKPDDQQQQQQQQGRDTAQSERQQVAGEDQLQEATGSGEYGMGEQQQQQQHYAAAPADILDDSCCADAATASYESDVEGASWGTAGLTMDTAAAATAGDDDDDEWCSSLDSRERLIGAAGASAAPPKAQAQHACKQQQQQQQQICQVDRDAGVLLQKQHQQQEWRQWQQLTGPTDQLAAEINMLHKQQQQQLGQQHHQQQQEGQLLKRARLDEHATDQQMQQTTGHQQQQRHLKPGQWHSASELPCSEWQPPDAGKQQVLICSSWQQQQQQLRYQPQQQHHHPQAEQASGLAQQHMSDQYICWQQQQETLGDSAQHSLGLHAGQPNVGSNGHIAQGRSAAGYSSSLSSSSKPGKTWTCLACTYSSNKQLMLRCEVCDTPKGSSSAPAAGWLCTSSAAGRNSKSTKQRQGSNHGRGQGNAAGGRSGRAGSSHMSAKQLTLKHVVQPAKSN